MKIEIKFEIWLASKTRWAYLHKVIPLPVVPRVGEFIKFNNKEMGDYFAWEISAITYRESGEVEASTELLNNIDERMYSFEEEVEFEEYFQSYLAEGWVCEFGVKPNTQYRPE